MYLPYYNCNTVYDAVTRAGFAVERYPLDARRLPVCPRWATASGCCMSTTFGIASDDLLAEVKRRWPRVILTTPRRFSAPRMDADSYNVYSCRKFVGVPDGAYLVHNNGLTDGIYPADTSWQHAAFCSAVSMKA